MFASTFFCWKRFCCVSQSDVCFGISSETEKMPQRKRKGSVDQEDDPSPTSTPATKRRKKSTLNYDPVNVTSVCSRKVEFSE